MESTQHSSLGSAGAANVPDGPEYPKTILSTTIPAQTYDRNDSQHSSAGAAAQQLPHAVIGDGQGSNSILHTTPVASKEQQITIPTQFIMDQRSAAAEPTANKPAEKFIRHYVLPDGTVVANGKGLGKGRPGIKRGPRQSKSASEEVQESSPLPSTPPIVNVMKRKRDDSIASNVPALSMASSPSRDSTPEYNPASSQTRSGRQTQRPVSIITATPTPVSPAPKRLNSASASSTPNLKTHPKIKRRVYKGKEQFALCEHCLRSFGPSNNVIVFCDACNKCWHQRCHNPPISKEVVTDAKAEWFCATCDKILHPGSKKVKKPSVSIKPEILATPAPRPVQQYGLPIVGAAALTLEQQRIYLNTLHKDKLIGIIINAGGLAPQLPMFETPLPLPTPALQKPLPQFASNYTTPVDTSLADVSKPGVLEMPDEGYDDKFDEHAALYPKAGEGVQLPPDRTDLHMLLEGPDSRTFSHWVRGTSMKNYLDNVTLVQG